MTNTSVAQSVPQEVLQVILKDVVRSAIPDERLLTALSLSHVCGLFRRAALQCPELWTCLSRRLGRPGLALIEVCIERSKEWPLDVMLHFYPIVSLGPLQHRGSMVVDNMFPVILSSSARWRSCSIRLTGEDIRAYDAVRSPSYDLHSFSNCVRIDAPMLEDFSIMEHPSLGERFDLMSPERDNIRDFRPGAHWNLPNLRNITLHNTRTSTIPTKLHAQIQSLEVQMTDVQTGFFAQILAMRELCGAVSLTCLRLSLKRCSIQAFPSATIAVLPSIRFLHIELLGCTQPPMHEYALWQAFWELQFPNVVELHLLFDFGIGDEPLVHWNGYNTALHSFLATNLVHQYRYPSLETLDISILSTAGPRAQNARTSMLLPHCCSPSLKHLRICASAPFTLFSSIDKEVGGELPDHLAIGDISAPIALRTVAFELPSSRGVASWVRGLVSKMRNKHCWDDFVELKFVGKGDTEVVPRDAVLQWCDANKF